MDRILLSAPTCCPGAWLLDTTGVSCAAGFAAGRCRQESPACRAAPVLPRGALAAALPRCCRAVASFPAPSTCAISGWTSCGRNLVSARCRRTQRFASENRNPVSETPTNRNPESAQAGTMQAHSAPDFGVRSWDSGNPNPDTGKPDALCKISLSPL